MVVVNYVSWLAERLVLVLMVRSSCTRNGRNFGLSSRRMFRGFRLLWKVNGNPADPRRPFGQPFGVASFPTVPTSEVNETRLGSRRIHDDRVQLERAMN